MSKPAPAIIPHKQSDAILAAVTDVKKQAHAWAGTGYRLVAVSHSTPEQMLSGAGSQTFGARWNPPGCFPGVYCSLLPETAVSESMNRFRRTGLKPRSPLPGVLVSMKIKLRTVLDFSKPGELKSLESFLLKATKENWQKLNDQGRESTSQAIGRAVHQLGSEGILFQSAVVPDAGNLVVFPHNLRAGSVLHIENESLLRKYVHE